MKEKPLLATWKVSISCICFFYIMMTVINKKYGSFIFVAYKSSGRITLYIDDSVSSYCVHGSRHTGSNMKNMHIS